VYLSGMYIMLFLGCLDIGSISVRTITRGTTATVMFSSHPDASFTCQLDGGAEVPCKYIYSAITLLIILKEFCYKMYTIFYWFTLISICIVLGTSPQEYTDLSIGTHSITLVSTCPGETKGISNTSTFRIRG